MTDETYGELQLISGLLWDAHLLGDVARAEIIIATYQFCSLACLCAWDVHYLQTGTRRIIYGRSFTVLNAPRAGGGRCHLPACRADLFVATSQMPGTLTFLPTPPAKAVPEAPQTRGIRLRADDDVPVARPVERPQPPAEPIAPTATTAQAGESRWLVSPEDIEYVEYRRIGTTAGLMSESEYQEMVRRAAAVNAQTIPLSPVTDYVLADIAEVDRPSTWRSPCGCSQTMLRGSNRRPGAALCLTHARQREGLQRITFRWTCGCRTQWSNDPYSVACITCTLHSGIAEPVTPLSTMFSIDWQRDAVARTSPPCGCLISAERGQPEVTIQRCNGHIDSLPEESVDFRWECGCGSFWRGLRNGLRAMCTLCPEHWWEPDTDNTATTSSWAEDQPIRPEEPQPIHPAGVGAGAGLYYLCGCRVSVNNRRSHMSIILLCDEHEATGRAPSDGTLRFPCGCHRPFLAALSAIGMLTPCLGHSPATAPPAWRPGPSDVPTVGSPVTPMDEIATVSFECGCIASCPRVANGSFPTTYCVAHQRRGRQDLVPRLPGHAFFSFDCGCTKYLDCLTMRTTHPFVCDAHTRF